jgi:ADP-heptose:LPS heptosyltransferase
LYLGDVILTLPAVHAIKARFPNAEIDYAARGAGADVLCGEPVFSRIFRVPEKEEGVGAMWRTLWQLRQRRYTAAVDFFSNPRSALLVWFTGARLRIGGDRRFRRRLYTHPTSIPSEIRSASDHHLYHLRPLGIGDPWAEKPAKPVLTISSDERSAAATVLGAAGIDLSKPVVGIHPGGKWEVKRWPADRFAELARRLVFENRQGEGATGGRVGEGGIQIVVMIGPGEERFQTEIRGAMGDRAVYLPTLPIRETAAIIGLLNGMVVSDGGIMHVSVAVGTPTVGIFGSAEPDIWFPYESYGPYAPAYVDIACRPCHSHVCDHLSCLRGLTVEAVEEKLFDVMNR